MGGNRKNFSIHVRQDRPRDFFQHDERGDSSDFPRSSGGYNSRDKFSGRGGQQHFHRGSSGGFRRGGRRGGRNLYRGGNRKYLDDGDVSMKDHRGNRHQQFFEQSRGQRRLKKNRPVINHNSGWHKITVRDAAIYSKEEVLGAIKELVDEDFIPFMMEFEGSHMVFFLEKSANVARAIVNLSGRITMGNNHKIIINCNEATPPLRKITPEQKEVIKAVMADRYASELKRLDLKNFHNDKTLVREQVFCPLYRRPNIECIMEILLANCAGVEEIDLSCNQITVGHDWQPLKHCPSLKRLYLEKNRIKHVDILVKLKGLPITELTLEGNPLCDKYDSAEKYTSAVRAVFPKVERLDGIELQKAIGFEVEDEVNLPPVRPSFFYSDEVKAVVVQFIEQYFQVFESENRKPLEAAYTEDAFFSLSVNFPDNGMGFKLSRPYASLNRNLKLGSKEDKRNSLLFRGRSAVGDALCRLPECTHDPNSFIIDIPFAQPVLMHVVLTGVFKQTTMKSPPYRNFMKSMIIVPVGSGFCISNEELYINTAAVEQIRASIKSASQSQATATPVGSPAPSVSSPVANSYPTAGLLPAQVQLIKEFTDKSKMLPEYSRMCLERNEWDFAKAGEMFLNLQKENKIPPEYFGTSS